MQMLYRARKLMNRRVKRNMKKILAFCLLLAMLIGCFPARATNEISEQIDKYSEELEFVRELGLMPEVDYATFDANAVVSRGEFAAILCQLNGINPSDAAEFSFVDIDSNEWKGYIASCVELGLMNGTGKYFFEPNRGVTVVEAAKCFLEMLGYKTTALLNGGYPNGYLNIANKLDLFDGINMDAHEIKWNEMARIIYNCADIPVVYVASYGETITYQSDESRTMMTEILKVNRIEGRVTDNGITSFDGESKVGIGGIVINDKVYSVMKGYDVADFIGHHIVAYAKKDNKNSTEKIIYIKIDSDELEDRVVFDIDDFIELNGREISYFDGDKEKKITLGSTPGIILNGKFEKSYDESFFDFDNGTVTFIPPMNGEDEMLIIDGYISWYLVGVNRDDGVISASNKVRKINDTHTLKLDKSAIGSTVSIYDQYGRSTDLKDIYVYTIVDISANDEVIKIKIPPVSAIDGVVEKMYTHDGNKIVQLGGVEYKMTKSVQDGEIYKNLTIGKTYRLFLDSFGKVAYIDVKVGADNLEIGYLIRCMENERPFSDNGVVRILTNEGLITVIETDKKIKFSDQYGDDFTISGNRLAESLAGYTGVIGYKLNSDNIIKELYMPVLSGYKREKGRLGCFYESINEYYYYSGGRTQLQGDAVFSADVPAFAYYPNENDDEEKYVYSQFQSIKKATPETSIVKGYNFDPNSRYAEYLYYESSGQLSNKVSNGARYAMVKEIEYTIDENLDEFYELSVYDFVSAGEKKYKMSKELFGSAISTTDYVSHEIMKGDILLCNIMGDEISCAQILYRSDMDNIMDSTGRRGNILGTIGYYDSANQSRSIPFIPNRAVDVRSGSLFTEIGRTMTASVYSVDDYGGVVFTTLDLSCRSYENDYDDEKYVTETVIPPANKGFSVVTYGNRGDADIDIRVGTLADIKPYVNVGKACSKLLLIQDYGEPKYFILFNNDMQN